MSIVQIAKATGNQVVFSVPVTGGNAIIVFAGFSDTPPGIGMSFWDCVDDKGQLYEGSADAGTSYDYGSTQCTGLANVQTQSFFFYPSVAGAQTITVDFNGGSLPRGTGDMIVYELTVPPPPSTYPFNITSNFIQDSGGDIDVPCGSFPANNPKLTDMFPGPPNGKLTPTYTYGPNQRAFMGVEIDSGGFGSVAAGWIMDTQNMLAVIHRPVVQGVDVNITDGAIVLTAPAYYSISADTFYDLAATFCGGIPSQIVGNPITKGTSKRVF